MKRAKKRCQPYASLFSDLNTKIFKLRIIRSRKISVFMWKSLVYFSAPTHFGVVFPHFVCSGDGTARMLPVVSVFAMFLLQGRVSVAFPVTSFFFVECF